MSPRHFYTFQHLNIFEYFQRFLQTNEYNEVGWVLIIVLDKVKKKIKGWVQGFWFPAQVGMDKWPESF